MKPLIDEPMYIEPRTYRNYEDYKVECGRARGWNQAMDFIFGERNISERGCRMRLTEEEKAICKEYGKDDEE